MQSKEFNNLKWPHIGTILAGGQSKRMGEPKEGVLLWDKKPMIDHLINTLSKITREILILGEPKGIDIKSRKDIKCISDHKPGSGPLGGIETLLNSRLGAEYLVVACDQPLLTVELLQKLIKSTPSSNIRLFAFEGFNELNPFPGIYPSSLLPHVKYSIQKGLTAMHEMIQSCPNITWVPINQSEAALLKSINTPEDLKELNTGRK